MTPKTSTVVDAIVVRGHQVASGNAQDSPYPAGSIELQKPHFKKLGLDLTLFHNGTLNFDISPRRFKVLKAKMKFELVQWIDGFPPETFSFSDCSIEVNDRFVSALIYYPHPETKSQHFHSDQRIEVIAPFVKDVQYGTKLRLHCDKQQIEIV